MGGSESPRQEPSTATLMWVGDTSLREFHDAYRYCVLHTSQIALRDDVGDAISRPAANVRWIVIARATRWPLERDALERLHRQHHRASWIELLGPLGDGVRSASIPMFQRVPWHRWESTFCGNLRPSQADIGAQIVNQTDARPAASASVAVLTTTHATAESYLDLAESAGMTSFWCSMADGQRLRHVSVAWWDDSLAPPTSAELWRRRLETFERGGRPVHHVWITNSRHWDYQQAAIRGGVSSVITKPFPVDSLLTSFDHDHQTFQRDRRIAA